MNRQPAKLLEDSAWLGWWRAVVIAVSVLILCSCETISPRPRPVSGPNTANSLPDSAWTGGPVGIPISTDASTALAGPWAPPGISQPWPEDERLRQGGDRGVRAQVKKNWQIIGMELEDTIGHFDTIDGKRIVVPSNRIDIYAPKFGVVRRADESKAYDSAKKAIGYHVPINPKLPFQVGVPLAATQPMQTVREVGMKLAENFQYNHRDNEIFTPDITLATGQSQLVKEDFLLERDSLVDMSEQPFLAKGIRAAVSWSLDKGVQIILDEQFASLEYGDQRAQATFTVDGISGTPRLEVLKTASTTAARPGDIVEFAIRFKNVGPQLIGNVTLVDNLTTRLEYVPESQTCQALVPDQPAGADQLPDLEADFFTQINEGDSLALRWEIVTPLKPGEGGIIRFRCKVR